MGRKLVFSSFFVGGLKTFYDDFKLALSKLAFDLYPGGELVNLGLIGGSFYLAACECVCTLSNYGVLRLEPWSFRLWSSLLDSLNKESLDAFEVIF